MTDLKRVAREQERLRLLNHIERLALELNGDYPEALRQTRRVCERSLAENLMDADLSRLEGAGTERPAAEREAA